MQNFSFFIPTKLFFGAGSLNKLAEVELPGKKALIVISSGTSMRKYGYLDRVISLLNKNGADCVVFDKIKANPVKSHVMEGAALAKSEGCDFVVGLGGGSSIDSAKSIAVMAKNPGDYWDYISGGSGKGLPVKGGALPIVAITTTAGTGTEADPWTVITKEETQEKIGYGSELTFPTLSIVDPELMLSVPPKFTAYQGFDALFHSTEGYISKNASPISDMFALKSISLIFKNLPTAVKDGGNIEARGNVALANTFSGIVESTSSCTSEHSIEHAMSAYHPDLPHGAGLIMISAAYHDFFKDVAPQRFAEMAAAAGVDTAKKSTDELASAFVCALKQLQKDCGVSDLRMSEYGISRGDFADIAKKARDTMYFNFDADRKQLTDDDVISILEKSFK
jgi:alcohol dehydrogenase